MDLARRYGYVDVAGLLMEVMGHSVSLLSQLIFALPLLLLSPAFYSISPLPNYLFSRCEDPCESLASQVPFHLSAA